MTERKLKIDLSPLWNNPGGTFILRFQDISEAQKILLAMRIKHCATQYRLRKLTGPTSNDIHQALIEINPIIFAESQNERRHPWQNFNVYETRQISGYRFKNLSQAIHQLTCIKKQPTQYQVTNIARLSCLNWRRTEEFVEQWFRNNNLETTEEERLTPITDLGINDIAEARASAERSNNTHTRDNRILEPTRIEDRLYITEQIPRQQSVRRTSAINEILPDFFTDNGI